MAPRPKKANALKKKAATKAAKKNTKKPAAKKAVRKGFEKRPEPKAKPKMMVPEVIAPRSAKAEALKKPKATKPTPRSSEHEHHEIVMTSLDQDKAQNVVSINLSGKSSMADYMVIATGTSSRHVTSMAEKLRDRLSKAGVRAKLEGMQTGDWVVVDGGDIVAHIFRAEVREYYNLEKLWATDFSMVDYTLYQH